MSLKVIILYLRNKIYFTVLLVVSLYSGFSQDSYKSIQGIEYTIKADNYLPSSNERQILSSISINNIKNIHLVRLNFKADILLNVQRDE